MKKHIILVGILVGFISCKSTDKPLNSTKSVEVSQTAQDTVRITSDKVEYEILIIEPGFNNWLMGRARPEGYYSQEFLENRNLIYVTEWNNRVLNPSRYSPNLYEMQINYDPTLDYGYEVNYKLYYYFIYFQMTYDQRLAGFVPRI